MPRGHAIAGRRIARQEITATCDVCGAEFTACRVSAKYCSGPCQKRGAARGKPQQQCVICGDWFHPPKATSVACSSGCRQTYVARSTVRARADKRRDSGTADWYRKIDGRHEHRTVAEEKIGRPLAADEVVHHVNGDRRDNRPENLEVMTRVEHSRMHTTERWEAQRAA